MLLNTAVWIHNVIRINFSCQFCRNAAKRCVSSSFSAVDVETLPPIDAVDGISRFNSKLQLDIF